MPFLKSISLKLHSESVFPFTLPIIQNFEKIELTSPVTIFVGENGSGKSTLIESIAVGMNSVAVGSDNLKTDPTLQKVRLLAEKLSFTTSKQPSRGFFFRAEDYFGFVKKMKSEIAELKDLESEYEDKYTGYAKLLTTGMAKGQHSALRAKYGDDPDAFSHGEGFLNLLRSRLVPEGLYILDEPETPLSPQNQIALLSLIKEMVAKDCQFIIATHSPILMAFTDAQILHFNEDVIDEIDYEDVEHVTLTKSFLNDPENFLRRL
ncbi:MAG: AAA family ATPase [Candidatus Delongbacteria bacterium]|jgi:predicted ATPase|nr:AAA family ATPase [Candidatus Delongbacteria bacterium]